MTPSRPLTRAEIDRYIDEGRRLRARMLASAFRGLAARVRRAFTSRQALRHGTARA